MCGLYNQSSGVRGVGMGDGYSDLREIPHKPCMILHVEDKDWEIF